MFSGGAQKRLSRWQRGDLMMSGAFVHCVLCCSWFDCEAVRVKKDRFTISRSSQISETAPG